MAKKSLNTQISVRFDEEGFNLIDAYAIAKNLSRPEAVRELTTSKINEMQTELIQIKTAINLAAAEAVETRKNIGKMSDILSLKVSNFEKMIIDQNADVKKKFETCGDAYKYILAILQKS